MVVVVVVGWSRNLLACGEDTPGCEDPQAKNPTIHISLLGCSQNHSTRANDHLAGDYAQASEVSANST